MYKRASSPTPSMESSGPSVLGYPSGFGRQRSTRSNASATSSIYNGGIPFAEAPSGPSRGAEVIVSGIPAHSHYHPHYAVQYMQRQPHVRGDNGYGDGGTTTSASTAFTGTSSTTTSSESRSRSSSISSSAPSGLFGPRKVNSDPYGPFPMAMLRIDDDRSRASLGGIPRHPVVTLSPPQVQRAPTAPDQRQNWLQQQQQQQQQQQSHQSSMTRPPNQPVSARGALENPFRTRSHPELMIPNSSGRDDTNAGISVVHHRSISGHSDDHQALLYSQQQQGGLPMPEKIWHPMSQKKNSPNESKSGAAGDYKGKGKGKVGRGWRSIREVKNDSLQRAGDSEEESHGSATKTELIFGAAPLDNAGDTNIVLPRKRVRSPNDERNAYAENHEGNVASSSNNNNNNNNNNADSGKVKSMVPSDGHVGQVVGSVVVDLPTSKKNHGEPPELSTRSKWRRDPLLQPQAQSGDRKISSESSQQQQQQQQQQQASTSQSQPPGFLGIVNDVDTDDDESFLGAGLHMEKASTVGDAGRAGAQTPPLGHIAAGVDSDEEDNGKVGTTGGGAAGFAFSPGHGYRSPTGATQIHLSPVAGGATQISPLVTQKLDGSAGVGKDRGGVDNEGDYTQVRHRQTRGRKLDAKDVPIPEGLPPTLLELHQIRPLRCGFGCLAVRGPNPRVAWRVAAVARELESLRSRVPSSSRLSEFVQHQIELTRSLLGRLARSGIGEEDVSGAIRSCFVSLESAARIGPVGSSLADLEARAQWTNARLATLESERARAKSLDRVLSTYIDQSRLQAELEQVHRNIITSIAKEEKESDVALERTHSAVSSALAFLRDSQRKLEELRTALSADADAIVQSIGEANAEYERRKAVGAAEAIHRERDVKKASSRVSAIEEEMTKLRRELTKAEEEKHAAETRLKDCRVHQHSLAKAQEALQADAEDWTSRLKVTLEDTVQRLAATSAATDQTAEAERAVSSIHKDRSENVGRLRKAALAAFVEAYRGTLVTAGELLSCKENRLEALKTAKELANDELERARLSLSPTLAGCATRCEELDASIEETEADIEAVEVRIDSALERFAEIEPLLKTNDIEYTHPSAGLEEKFREVRRVNEERKAKIHHALNTSQGVEAASEITGKSSSLLMNNSVSSLSPVRASSRGGKSPATGKMAIAAAVSPAARARAAASGRIPRVIHPQIGVGGGGGGTHIALSSRGSTATGKRQPPPVLF